MKHIILSLPKYRLSMNFRFIKRRKSSLDEPIIPSVKLLNLKYRVGGITRKLFRHLFEHKRVRALLGTNMALMIVASSFMTNTAIGNIQTGTPVYAVDGTETPISTEIGTQFPTDLVRITQGYNFFHPGLDLDGITGDTIKPIKKGKVISIDHSKFAYGNSVIIDHGNDLTSLYAHMSKINVTLGQEVTTNTKVGEMGATGRSFGDHLHLEIRDHGVTLNPLSVLPR
ncbi:MAG: hypothetical protein UR39_C0010G0047 [Candidatus Woesebacteria bacterium GW2011_GWA1_33_30]|uniref:M23ase beta-sheet core domain-containing protein n=1 Tax=Candidatus Woesebacteria bacterium GW2011_GWA2_33_28 TaxID=1618561 RepID=A0A0G0C5L7_9BACT|nr:MAG: hypothetical protein UR38_C0010G0046 [Candidatus Woesebacteria bacterium GW2011_GWA2_33_28]KKP47305.1 MAG: hypothetical protein UR39_C0010G0047 [Candidatus Woesebacteria bacterium GW2011_GWA1_33_30]KKP48950.1 MAG: hypothetical protein UR40_C0011G0046 [Microgenomates group bacterium GW2011_GWC1_33_32]KKP51488.1 MAG: hypothetical protein UR44_C0010G0046 [Candidatus Woesebacteria bacterium GW2011_GWB1_33_38]